MRDTMYDKLFCPALVLRKGSNFLCLFYSAERFLQIKRTVVADKLESYCIGELSTLKRTLL